MAKTPMYDPGSSEVRSPIIAGLTEGVSKLSDILNVETAKKTLTLQNVKISDTDKNRIYQAPTNSRLWIDTPAPVIKKNGSVITQESDNFTIDYVGGSIAFEKGSTLEDSDVVTADVTYCTDNSKTINDINASIDKLEEEFSEFNDFITGEGAPTDQTEGKVGQDYVDITTGDKYHLISDSGGAYKWEQYQDKISIDSEPTSGSDAVVNSGGVYDALSKKQNTLEFDDTPEIGSDNPVTSDGIYESLEAKQDKIVGSEGQIVGFDSSGAAKAVDTFDMAQFALQAICPNNHILYDDKGKPGVYVYIPKFRLCDVLSTDSTQVHPAFIRNGKEVDGFYMGKYQSSVSDNRAYSLPGKDPGVNINLDTSVICNRNKGDGFHEVTAAEWAAVALWCHKNGFEPRGNNNYGKDSTETLYKAVPSMDRDEQGKIQRVATGTGPVTWSHDGTLAGIWDMKGNVFEWCTGLRIVHGELQVIPHNNAADPTCDLSAASKEWKAINANAISWSELFVDPNSNGATDGTVKLGFVNSNWTYTTSVPASTYNGGCPFTNVSYDSTIGIQAKLLLQSLAMLPDTALVGEGIAADYNGDYFYVNNAEAETCLRHSGTWSNTNATGVFHSHLNYTRTNASAYCGGRSAYQE